jgi:acyl carrier protein
MDVSERYRQLAMLQEAGRTVRAVTVRRTRNGLGLQAVHCAPATDVQRWLADIWSEILDIDGIGIDDSFFECSGDSLQMTQVIARVIDQLAVQLPIERFFDGPTIRELAAIIEDAMGDGRPMPAAASADERGNVVASALSRVSVAGTASVDEGAPANPHTRGMAPAKIGTIGIITARRPASLARCLSSYMRNAATFSRRPSFLVFDDAATEPDREACIDAARETLSNGAADLAYVGSREKQAIVRHLANTGAAPPEIVDFAFSDAEQIGRGTNGANRNMLVWFTHGEPVLSVDDDTICDTYLPVDTTAQVIVADNGGLSDRAPSEVWPLGVHSDTSDVCRRQLVDCLGEHERWLGRDVARLDAFRHIRGATNEASARVAISANGLIGDCGWGSPSEYLFLRDRSWDRLTGCEATYRASVTSRRIVRTVRQPVLSARVDDFMSTFFALDNRLVLPPFLPVCRGTDRVFAGLTALCRTGWFVHVPFVLRHEPGEARRFWPGEIGRSAAGVDLSTLVCSLLDALPPAPRHLDATARLGYYGRALADAAGGSSRAFVETASAVIKSTLARTASELEARVASGGEWPHGWRNDAVAYAAALGKTIERADVHVPLDVRLGRSLEAAEALTRRVVMRYGQLLEYWPSILQQRARLDPEGLRLTLTALHPLD